MISHPTTLHRARLLQANMITLSSWPARIGISPRLSTIRQLVLNQYHAQERLQVRGLAEGRGKPPEGALAPVDRSHRAGVF